MKFTKIRTLVAAGTIGLVGITGIAAAGVAGAQTTDATTEAAQGRGAFIKSLTAEQRSCLKDNGVTRPDHKLTAEERQAFVANLRTAADTCGVTLPQHPARSAKAEAIRDRIQSLTADQKACLTSNGVAKPDHKLTKSERQEFVSTLKSAAQTCGITAG